MVGEAADEVQANLLPAGISYVQTVAAPAGNGHVNVSESSQQCATCPAPNLSAGIGPVRWFEPKYNNVSGSCVSEAGIVPVS